MATETSFAVGTMATEISFSLWHNGDRNESIPLALYGRNGWHYIADMAGTMATESSTGEEKSENWFHIAREYTEKWHHQQQIREAVHRPGLMTREFYFPVLDTFMRALPYTWRNTKADENAAVKIMVSGDAGGSWTIIKKSERWDLAASAPDVDTTITLAPEIAWKVFTKGVSPAEARHEIRFDGNLKLGEPILTMLAVMA